MRLMGLSLVLGAGVLTAFAQSTVSKLEGTLRNDRDDIRPTDWAGPKQFRLTQGRAPDEILKHAGFAVWKMPAILVEAGFMRHPSQAKQILDPACRRPQSRVLVDGILTCNHLVER